MGGDPVKGGAVMSGISALIKEAPETALSPSTMLTWSQKTVREPGSGFSTSRRVSNKYLLFLSPTVYDILQ